jgi:hypothetical protein
MDGFGFPLGNIQMVGKSQGPMYKGEKPLEAGLASSWTLDKLAQPKEATVKVPHLLVLAHRHSNGYVVKALIPNFHELVPVGVPLYLSPHS